MSKIGATICVLQEKYSPDARFRAQLLNQSIVNVWLGPLVFVRPGELRHAEGNEINFDAADGRIPTRKMKARQLHIVPLSSQAVAILRELNPLTGVRSCH